MLVSVTLMFFTKLAYNSANLRVWGIAFFKRASNFARQKYYIYLYK